MMGINSEYSWGTQSMAACSSSSVAAADVRSVLFCVGVNGNCFWFSLVHRCWQLVEVNLMCPLLASRLHMCFASHQRGRIASWLLARGATSNNTFEKWCRCCSIRGAV